MHGIDLSRRGFLRGSSSAPPAVRPPWARAEDVFIAGCTRCQACIEACPEAILIRGSGGYPEIDFRRGECTFCQACVTACEQPLFEPPDTARPWTQVASVGPSCLGHQQIYCRSCGESCEAEAIRFDVDRQPVPIPVMAAERCSGCGACVATCPVDAIVVGPPPGQEDA